MFISFLLVLDGGVSGSARVRILGGLEIVARCDDVTEIITVEKEVLTCVCGVRRKVAITV